jgi:hypothetical protein
MKIVHDKLIFLPGSALPNGNLSDGKQSDEEEKFRIHLSFSVVSRFVLESVTPSGNSALGFSVVALLNNSNNGRRETKQLKLVCQKKAKISFIIVGHCIHVCVDRTCLALFGEGCIMTYKQLVILLSNGFYEERSFDVCYQLLQSYQLRPVSTMRRL